MLNYAQLKQQRGARIMYKLQLTESNGRVAFIYFRNNISVSYANGRTYVRDECGGYWQTDENVESVIARIDALLAAVV